MTDVWVANDEGSEIVRARDIAVASLDYNGNVNVRLVGPPAPAATQAAGRGAVAASGGFRGRRGQGRRR
jgi:hypothetical protein